MNARSHLVTLIRLSLNSVALCLLLGAGFAVPAANLANPGINLPPMRLSIGATYDLSAYAITNQEVHSLLNRYLIRLNFSPAALVDFGVDIGGAQMEVDSYTGSSDTIGVFSGKPGLSGGAHVKISSPPLAHENLSVLLLGSAGYFSSKNTHGALYDGFDIAAAAAVQYRFPEYGSVSAGVKAAMLYGSNRSYIDKKSDQRSNYSSVNNVHGWVAFDFLPTFRGEVKGRPYFSFELSAAPGAGLGERVPLHDAAIGIALGWISPRLSGEDFEDVN